MELYVGTSSGNSRFIEAIANHIEAQGIHPSRIEVAKGAYRSQLTVECTPHEAAEVAAHFASYKSTD